MRQFIISMVLVFFMIALAAFVMPSNKTYLEVSKTMLKMRGEK